ncbi:MAG: hypothetical protein O3A46_02160 [Candidatus Poribacteria bacterium]|nr:hypothetical protein [Candidatus Poribacteria bacterium]
MTIFNESDNLSGTYDAAVRKFTNGGWVPTIRVQYTVRAEFADRNQENINAVMTELRSLGNDDVQYASYRLEDGKTFMHLVHYNSEDAEELPSSLASFAHFQKELRPNLETPPDAQDLELVGSSFEIFG